MGALDRAESSALGVRVQCESCPDANLDCAAQGLRPEP